MHPAVITYLQHTRQNNSYNQSIDSNSLTEDHRNQVLGLDARSTYTTANNAHSRGVDTPVLINTNVNKYNTTLLLNASKKYNQLLRSDEMVQIGSLSVK